MANKIDLKTSKPVVPMIYAYTTPGITYHDGYIKIGYTEQDVDTRIKQQTHTAGVMAKKEWMGTAIFDDGSGETFDDHPFHAYLRKNGIKQPQDLGNPYFSEDDRNEWFNTTPQESKMHFYDFKANKGVLLALDTAMPYQLRKEQEEAVSKTVDYYKSHEKGEFLWNAKPRFGKTLSVYDFCKRVGAASVLIVTNRPAIANSWNEDYEKFLGEESGYRFVSGTDALKDKPYVLSRAQYMELIDKEIKETIENGTEPKTKGFIEFISLQDLKGSKYFSPNGIDKLKEEADTNWDILVVDEAHEGVDTYKTDTAFDHIKRKFTLHLSGTPFKALANEKFASDAIYNWTYADEQAAKANWSEDAATENPYINLPKLNLYTYQMSEIVKDEIKQGIDIEGENYEYAFDLNEFFAVNENGSFRYNSSVDRFLDALASQEKFPFSTPELRAEIKHSFWLLHRVDSAKALAKKLKDHPVFKDYEIIVAAGDGKLEEGEVTPSELKKSYDKVVKAIRTHEKTITLSVGQLTTGVTIPEWTAVLMLSNMQSPAQYMQAAFRAQNPCLFHEGAKSFRKENAYVFDFDPARTLIIFEQFANDLYPRTSAGKGDGETRKEQVRELLNFFPVIGEDEDGEMVLLDAEKILTIPRKLKSKEVVKRGFMSNFLFQNIGNIFSAPAAVAAILQKIAPVKESKAKDDSKIEDQAKDIPTDDKGELAIPVQSIENKAEEIFGGKVYEIKDIAEEAAVFVKEEPVNTAISKLTDALKSGVVAPILNTTKEAYQSDIRRSDQKAIEKQLNEKVEKIATQKISDLNIQKSHLESEMKTAIEEGADAAKATEEFKQKTDALQKQFMDDIADSVGTLIKESQETATKIAETSIKEREKKGVEDKVRDHLRGFSRTIPSFLMAYGDDDTSLETFDTIVPDEVFQEVTRNITTGECITLDDFRFLRDGGDYTDEAGIEQHYEGHLFNPIVFDDSVKEFLNLKKKLADYFDEKAIEDIFDYIPPQRTNQIFTPKMIVKKMADMLEEEEPGCFDDPNKTFIDLYMKSGLYITEIVKRLYQSPKMKEIFPDDKERLRHIFEKQVYGLAPTEIIYRISTNYILGFSDEIPIEKHNLRKGDALPHAKAGDLEEWLSEVFGKEA